MISDHGIPQARIDAAVEAGKRVLRPDRRPQKLKYKLPVGGQRGYTPFGVETAKGEVNFDLKEFWHVGRDLPPGHRYRSHMADNVWPDADVAEFHETVGWLYNALDQMGLKVLEAISTYLGLERHFFDPIRWISGIPSCACLHYPPVPADGPNIRAAAHEDINVITLLLGAEEAGPGGLGPRRPMAGGQSTARLAGLQHRRHAAAVDQPQAAVDDTSGGQSGAGAPRRAALFDAVLPALQLGLRDQDPAELRGCRPVRTAIATSITADEFLQERLREIKLA